MRVDNETFEALESLAKLKKCRLNVLLGDVLNDYVELGLAQAEMEGEIEAQTGVVIPIDGATPGPHLLN